MKLIFKDKCIVKMPSRKVAENFAEVLVSLGLKPEYVIGANRVGKDKYFNEFYEKYPNIGINHGELDSFSLNSSERTISIQEFMDKILNGVQAVEIKLNEKYTAIVGDGKVKVGCQEFSFDVVEKLYKAVQESKNN